MKKTVLPYFLSIISNQMGFFFGFVFCILRVVIFVTHLFFHKIVLMKESTEKNFVLIIFSFYLLFFPYYEIILPL